MLTKVWSWGCWLGVPWFLFCFMNLKKGCIVYGTNNNDNCDQTYLGVWIFHEKAELAIYNME